LQRGIFDCSTTDQQKPNSTTFDIQTAALLKAPIAVVNDVTSCRWKSSSGRFGR